MSECTHENIAYYPELNEAGWKCLDCEIKPGEPEGYSPGLDRSHTYDKVYRILDDLHNSNLVYCSNGTGADVLCEIVVTHCKRTGLYDQISIMQYILALGFNGHAAYWKTVGDGIVSGNDPRDRCTCGKLATTYQGDKKSCSECEYL